MSSTGLRIMADAYKCFYEKKADGFIQLICFLVGDFVNELVLPLEVWPCSCSYDQNYVELVDAQSVVHVVLDPKIIHFDQISRNRFVVNFYTKDGDEVDYGRTKDPCDKCLVLGCHDPRMYQPIPHKMLLNTERFRGCKRVPIEFNGVVTDIGITFSRFSKLRKLVGVAFTDLEWERVCESSNSGAVFGKSFVIEFNSCADRKGYLSIPAAFHCHLIRCGYRDVWLNGNGRSLYMCMKIHIDKRSRSEKNLNVHLVGEMDRLKEVLELIVGDRMVFELLSGTDEFFSVIKLNGSF
ncbi:hypothetical protein Tco_0710350 [Tanacetum coccineum]